MTRAWLARIRRRLLGLSVGLLVAEAVLRASTVEAPHRGLRIGEIPLLPLPNPGAERVRTPARGYLDHDSTCGWAPAPLGSQGIYPSDQPGLRWRRAERRRKPRSLGERRARIPLPWTSTAPSSS